MRQSLVLSFLVRFLFAASHNAKTVHTAATRIILANVYCYAFGLIRYTNKDSTTLCASVVHMIMKGLPTSINGLEYEY
jgi:hypothetical protein